MLRVKPLKTVVQRSGLERRGLKQKSLADLDPPDDPDACRISFVKYI